VQCIAPTGLFIAGAVYRLYSLGLTSTAHASPAAAARIEKCQISYPLPLTSNILCLKPSMVYFRATLKISTRSHSQFPSYKRTNRHTKRLLPYKTVYSVNLPGHMKCTSGGLLRPIIPRRSIMYQSIRLSSVTRLWPAQTAERIKVLSGAKTLGCPRKKTEY